jgi:hypothetical protein
MMAVSSGFREELRRRFDGKYDVDWLPRDISFRAGWVILNTGCSSLDDLLDGWPALFYRFPNCGLKTLRYIREKFVLPVPVDWCLVDGRWQPRSLHWLRNQPLVKKAKRSDDA